MSLRRRSYIIEMIEMTTSGSVPGIVKPMALIRRVRPGALMAKMTGRNSRRKRLIKRASARFSGPLPPRI